LIDGTNPNVDHFDFRQLSEYAARVNAGASEAMLLLDDTQVAMILAAFFDYCGVGRSKHAT